MRIGIITQPLTANYGGILQNYALQQVLIRMGHEPMTIDFLPIKVRIKNLLWYLPHYRKPNKWFFMHHQQRFIKQFIRHHITKTHHVRKYRIATVKRYRFNVLIAGSDQIWRPRYNSYLTDMFFQFATLLPIKKIVYGASFGADQWEYDLQTTECCRDLVQQINAVSVREKSGVELCRQYFGIEAQWVLDPTLLLDTEDYERLCARIPRAGQSFIAAYLLDVDEELTDRVKALARDIELPLRFFSAGEAMTLSVEEWLAMFRDATYVITDSFHGTIFSILFNRPFISVGNHARGTSRFLSLLEQFGLEERLSPEISAEILLRPILWNEINRRKHLFEKGSRDFLQHELNG